MPDNFICNSSVLSHSLTSPTPSMKICNQESKCVIKNKSSLFSFGFVLNPPLFGRSLKLSSWVPYVSGLVYRYIWGAFDFFWGDRTGSYHKRITTMMFYLVGIPSLSREPRHEVLPGADMASIPGTSRVRGLCVTLRMHEGTYRMCQ